MADNRQVRSRKLGFVAAGVLLLFGCKYRASEEGSASLASTALQQFANEVEVAGTKEITVIIPKRGAVLIAPDGGYPDASKVTVRGKTYEFRAHGKENRIAFVNDSDSSLTQSIKLTANPTTNQNKFHVHLLFWKDHPTVEKDDDIYFEAVQKFVTKPNKPCTYTGRDYSDDAEPDTEVTTYVTGKTSTENSTWYSIQSGKQVYTYANACTGAL